MDTCSIFEWRKVECKWTGRLKTPFYDPRRNATLVGHKIWVIGGRLRRDRFCVLNTVSNTWESILVKGIKLSPLSCRTANLFEDKILLYVIHAGHPGGFFSDLWVCDLALNELRTQPTNGRESLEETPHNPYLSSADVCEKLSVMAVYGGHSGEGASSLWILDMNAWTWVNPVVKGKAPPPTQTHASCIVDTTLYIYNKASRFVSDADLYMTDLAGTSPHVWHKVPFQVGNVDGRLDAAMAYVGHGRMIIFGGYNSRGSRGPTNDLIIIDDLLSPERTCHKVPSLTEPFDLSARTVRDDLWCVGERPSKRDEATLLVAHNKLYLIGGSYDDKWCYFELVPYSRPQ